MTGWALDAPLQGKEAELQSILKRMASVSLDWVKNERSKVQTPHRDWEWSPPHLLDLRDGKSGIGPHVDLKEASGAVICCLSLLSPCVLRFTHTQRPQETFKVLIPPMSMYCQRDDLRYLYTHEIPMTDDPDHSIDGEKIIRNRRLAILLRDKLV